MTKWSLFQGCKAGSIQKYINIIHHINGLKKKNHIISVCSQQLNKGYVDLSELLLITACGSIIMSRKV